jgi:hypothetical protein
MARTTAVVAGLKNDVGRTIGPTEDDTSLVTAIQPQHIMNVQGDGCNATHAIKLNGNRRRTIGFETAQGSLKIIDQPFINVIINGQYPALQKLELCVVQSQFHDILLE